MQPITTIVMFLVSPPPPCGRHLSMALNGTLEIPTFKSPQEYKRAYSFSRDCRDGCKISSCSMTVSFFKDLSCQPPLPIHAEIGRGTNSKHGETTEGGIIAHSKEGSAQPTFLLFSCREADRSLSRWCYSKVF